METEKQPSQFKEVTREIVGWDDNKVFRTLKGLTLLPGKTIKGYCGSDKQKYLSPVTYFIGVAAVEAYIASFVGLYDSMIKKSAEDFKRAMSDPAMKQLFDTEKISQKVHDYLLFVTSETGQKIWIVPVFLLLTWLFYKKFNKSFRDNSWFALYTMGHGTLLAIPLMVVWYVSQNVILYSSLSIVLMFVYGVWASKQFYDLTLKRALIIRFILTIALLISVNILTVGVVIAAFVIYAR